MNTLNYRLFFFFFSGICTSYFGWATGQIVVLEPETLANKYHNSRITGSTSAFGTPFYGDRIAAQVVWFPVTGCDAKDYDISDDKFDSGLGLPKVVMIRRGGCNFVTKVSLAEAKGAIAVLIADNEGSQSTSSDIRQVIMADDGWGEKVTIPGILLSDLDAEPMIRYLSNGSRVVIELAWDLPNESSVQMDMWLTPAIAQSANFINQFAPYAVKMQHKIDFRPHYYVMSLPKNFKNMCTDETGKYCGLDPDWGGKVTGKNILEETVRQICLWETTKSLEKEDPESGFYSEQWWKYMASILKACPFKSRDGLPEKEMFGQECSYSHMKDLRINVGQVKKCVDEKFEFFLETSKQNRAWSPTAVMLNQKRYSGPLDPEIVMKAICTGYEQVPEECEKIIGKGTVETENYGLFATTANGFPLGWIITLSVLAILSGLALSMLLFWKFILPKMKNKMQYMVMDEVRKNTNLREGDTVRLTGSKPQPSTSIPYPTTHSIGNPSFSA